jgi:hypothetical protein
LVVSLLAATLFHEILIKTTSSGMSDQLRDIYSICRYCCNVVTYKWKIYNEKNVIISFVVSSTSGEETANPSEVTEATPDFGGVLVTRSYL